MELHISLTRYQNCRLYTDVAEQKLNTSNNDDVVLARNYDDYESKRV